MSSNQRDSVPPPPNPGGAPTPFDNNNGADRYHLPDYFSDSKVVALVDAVSSSLKMSASSGTIHHLVENPLHRGHSSSPRIAVARV